MSEPDGSRSTEGLRDFCISRSPTAGTPPPVEGPSPGGEPPADPVPAEWRPNDFAGTRRPPAASAPGLTSGEPSEPSEDDEAEPDALPDQDELSAPELPVLLRQARFMLDMERPRDALRALQDAVDWYPEDHATWCEVTRAFYALDDGERALRAAEWALQTDPYSAEGYVWKCRLLLRSDNWKGAAETARTGSEMTYRDPEVERWAVRAWLAGGNREEAGKHLTLLATQREDADTACLHGEIARLGSQIPAADAAFRRAIQLDAGNGEAWAGLASVLVEQHRPEDAVTCIHRALQLEPGRPELGSRTVEVVDALLGRRAPGFARYGVSLMVISVICTPGLSTLILFPLALLWYLIAKPIDHHRRKQALNSLPADLGDYYRSHKKKEAQDIRSGVGCLLGLLLGVVAVIAVLVGLFTRFGWDGATRILLLCLLALPFVLDRIFSSTPAEPEVRFRFPGDPYVPEETEEDEETVDDGPPPDWEPNPTWAGWQLLDEGKAAAAQEKARSVLANDPENVEGLVLFSNATFLLGEFEPSMSAAKSARALEPDEARAHALVWASLAAVGRLEEAVASAEEERVHADEADDFLVWQIRYQFHFGSVETARALSELVQRLYPGSSEPHEVEGEWALYARRWPEAQAAFERALALEPESALLHAYMGLTLERRWRPGKARAAARTALALDPREQNALGLLERHAGWTVLGLAILLSAALALAAAAPTVAGSRTNWWMAAATFLCPLQAAGLSAVLIRPFTRRIAPGLLLAVERHDLINPHAVAWIAGSVVLLFCLTLHSGQAWLEIALHRELLPVRWPGAATVTLFAAAAWWVVRKNVRFNADE